MTFLGRIPGKPAKGVVNELAQARVVGPPFRHDFFINRIVFHAHCVLGCALKGDQLFHLRRKGLNHLNTGRTIANHANP